MCVGEGGCGLFSYVGPQSPLLFVRSAGSSIWHPRSLVDAKLRNQLNGQSEIHQTVTPSHIR